MVDKREWKFIDNNKVGEKHKFLLKTIVFLLIFISDSSLFPCLLKARKKWISRVSSHLLSMSASFMSFARNPFFFVLSCLLRCFYLSLMVSFTFLIALDKSRLFSFSSTITMKIEVLYFSFPDFIAEVSGTNFFLSLYC